MLFINTKNQHEIRRALKYALEEESYLFDFAEEYIEELCELFGDESGGIENYNVLNNKKGKQTIVNLVMEDVKEALANYYGKTSSYFGPVRIANHTRMTSFSSNNSTRVLINIVI